MGNVITELGKLIFLAEAEIPANPESAKNQKFEKDYRKVLSEYFRNLSKALPYSQIVDLYSRSIKEAGPTGEAKDLLTPILQIFRTKLLTELIGHHVSIYLSGSAEVTSWGMTKTGRYIDYEGPPMQQAIEYARQHCAQLVTKMDDESKTRIAQVIADGIENKIGIDGLERDLRATFMDMSGTRAEMIARTETCDALEQAFMDRAEELGIDGKEWVVLSPCPICEENAAAGPIGIDETFPSGDIRPPAHPNCRCALSPVLLNKGGK